VTKLSRLSIDRNFHNDTRLNTDRRDLLHNVGGRREINQALVNAHLETVPCVGTLATRRLPRRNLQSLRRHTDRALNLQVLVLCAANEIRADLLECLDIAARESDTDFLVLALAQAFETRLLHRCGSHVYPWRLASLSSRPVAVTNDL
jgi:hypothetical protein